MLRQIFMDYIYVSVVTDSLDERPSGAKNDLISVREYVKVYLFLRDKRFRMRIQSQRKIEMLRPPLDRQPIRHYYKPRSHSQFL